MIPNTPILLDPPWPLFMKSPSRFFQFPLVNNWIDVIFSLLLSILKVNLLMSRFWRFGKGVLFKWKTPVSPMLFESLWSRYYWESMFAGEIISFLKETCSLSLLINCFLFSDVCTKKEMCETVQRNECDLFNLLWGKIGVSLSRWLVT